MVRLLTCGGLMALMLGVPIAAAVADPLTSPITTTTTQYVIESVTFSLLAGTVTVTVQLQDSTGKVIRLIQITDTLVNMGITPARQATLSAWIVIYLKAQGHIN